MSFPKNLLALAREVLDEARTHQLHIVTAESCTGGLIAGLLTEIPGSSDVVERGFVTYSNAAKSDLLGVPAAMIAEHGAVSAPVARAMVQGALKQSPAELAVAVTGIAGPGGGSAEKPVGLVYIAAARRGAGVVVRQFRFGDIGRDKVRAQSVAEALGLLRGLI